MKDLVFIDGDKSLVATTPSEDGEYVVEIRDYEDGEKKGWWLLSAQEAMDLAAHLIKRVRRRCHMMENWEDEVEAFLAPMLEKEWEDFVTCLDNYRGLWRSPKGTLYQGVWCAKWEICETGVTFSITREKIA